MNADKEMNPPPPKQPDPAEVYRELRGRALGMRPEEAGAAPAGGENQPYGVLMETGYPNGVATLVAFASGDASLYFSTGGGIIGGIGHESVRIASQHLIESANPFLPEMEKTTAFPLPEAGRVRFYVLTLDGAFTAEAAPDDLSEERHALSPLFFAAHQVITELRLVTQQ